MTDRSWRSAIDVDHSSHDNSNAAEWRGPEWPGLTQRDREAYQFSCVGTEPYTLGRESRTPVGGLQGRVESVDLADSTVYPGVPHACQVYLPADGGPDEEQSLVVFLDGSTYLGPEANAATVLDNLIGSGAIPPTIGVFLDPGPHGPGLPLYGGTDNRSLEYDSVGDEFVTFLLNDVLPSLEARHNIAADPARRALCGISSGGSAAFAAAWHRPDSFGNVISHCGSFVDIRGAGAFPALIRRSPARPLRVFLQTGRRDLDIVFGDWWLANLEMASALEYVGYDCQLVVGDGGHTLAHGAALLPETLRWLWATKATAEPVVDLGADPD